MDLSDLTVVPLSPDTWDAFEALVERHNGIFSGCWCTWFTSLERDPERTYESNRELKRTLVHKDRNHAALVMDGDEAVAWAEYGPPCELPNIHHRKQYDETKDRDPDWRITCIFVDRRYRRSGVAKLALQGALDLIAASGGGLVEGYPHERPTKKVSSSFLYNGTRPMYEAAGFTFDRSKGLKNTVMRREVAPAG